MAIPLAHAPSTRPRRLRLAVGVAATVVCVGSSAVIVRGAFHTRMNLQSFVGGGWCGTNLVSLQSTQQSVLPCCVAPLAAAVLAHRAGVIPAVSRFSVAAAFAAWLIFGFVG